MKSGTTYLQNILSSSREQLSSNGWIYPGKKANHQHETYGICGQDIFWVNESTKEKNKKSGQRLLEEIKEARDNSNVIVSSEALSSLDESGVARFVEKVGHPDEIILTVRSLFRVLPSAWQQSLKGGHDRSAAEFFNLLESQRVGKSGFWKTYSFGDVVRKWSTFSPVKVIVVPEESKDKSALWRSFATAAGLPLNVESMPDASKSNISLNLETTFFLRAMIRVIKNDKKYSGEKLKIIGRYLNEMVFPLAESKRGRAIFPLIDYNENLMDWSGEEVAVMQKYAEEIIGSSHDLVNYTGSFYQGSEGFLDESLLESYKEPAYQVVDYFSNHFS
jgi:hypothetical protein